MNQEELQRALRSLGAENAGVPVPPGVEARVMAAFDARRARRRRSWLAPATAGVLVASLAIVSFLLHRPVAPAAREAQAPFVAIPYVAPPAPYERTEVKRMDVPLAALMAAGLEVQTTNQGGTVPAEVLVGQDGRPLAIRLVKNAI